MVGRFPRGQNRELRTLSGGVKSDGGVRNPVDQREVGRCRAKLRPGFSVSGGTNG